MMKTRDTFQQLIKTIEEAGVEARVYFDSDNVSSESKRDGSAVTVIDGAIERQLRTFIAEHFPDDSIVGEEEEGVVGTSEFVWHIDPIDGTDNFLRKIPFCAISVARLGNTTEDSFAIVHNPITKHTFSSFMDEGVYENQRLADLTAEPLGGKYVICTGFGRSESWMLPARHALRAALETKFGKSQSYGSTALELAYLAAGRIDGYVTYGLYSYDYAAGFFLVSVAGGQISVYEEGEWRVWKGSIKELCAVHGRTIFASHPEVHERIRDYIGNPKVWATITG